MNETLTAWYASDGTNLGILYALGIIISLGAAGALFMLAFAAAFMHGETLFACLGALCACFLFIYTGVCLESVRSVL